MTIRKITLTGLALALAVTLLLVLSACNITVNWWPGVTDPEAGLSFSLEWSDNGTDVPHLYMTYPAPASGDTTDSGTPIFFDPYSPPLAGDYGFAPSDPFSVAGDVPNENTDERGTVYYGNPESSYPVSGIRATEMIEENDAYEIILVRGFPFASSSTFVSTTGGDLTGLAVGSYTWVGVMEAYAYATSGQLEYANGNGVNAVLNVFDDDELLAAYELPANTDLKGTSIVRINCFYDDNGYEIYQLVPDIRVIQSTTQIRSVAPGAVIDESGIITVRMPVAE